MAKFIFCVDFEATVEIDEKELEGCETTAQREDRAWALRESEFMGNLFDLIEVEVEEKK